MKSLIILAVIFVLDKSADALEAKCKGIDIQVPEEHMMDIKECAKSVSAETVKDLNPANAGCFSKCIMEKKKLVDGEGKPHKENILKAIDNHLPEALKGDWTREMEKCLDNQGSKIKSPDDATCTSYLPLALCVHMAFINICKS